MPTFSCTVSCMEAPGRNLAGEKDFRTIYCTAKMSSKSPRMELSGPPDVPAWEEPLAAAAGAGWASPVLRRGLRLGRGWLRPLLCPHRHSWVSRSHLGLFAGAGAGGASLEEETKDGPPPPQRPGSAPRLSAPSMRMAEEGSCRTLPNAVPGPGGPSRRPCGGWHGGPVAYPRPAAPLSGCLRRCPANTLCRAHPSCP